MALACVPKMIATFGSLLIISTFLMSPVRPQDIIRELVQEDVIIQFLYFANDLEFQEAVIACQDFNPDAFLARVDTEEEFNFIIEEFINQAEVVVDEFWIGLEDPDDMSENGETNAFQFIDGVQDGVAFFAVPFQFPWGENQPNGGSDNNCVAIDDSGSWNDGDCEDDIPFLCRLDIAIVNVDVDIDIDEDEDENQVARTLLLIAIFIVTGMLLVAIALWRKELRMRDAKILFLNQYYGEEDDKNDKTLGVLASEKRVGKKRKARAKSKNDNLEVDSNPSDSYESNGDDDAPFAHGQPSL